MQEQIYKTNYFLVYVDTERVSISSQYALSSLIERWEKIIGDRGFGGAVLVDFSKAYDVLNQKLLIAKCSTPTVLIMNL